jgi:hypothetical protein
MQFEAWLEKVTLGERMQLEDCAEKVTLVEEDAL